VIVAERCLSDSGLLGTRDDPSGVTQAVRREGAEVIDTGDNDTMYSPMAFEGPGIGTHPISRFLLEAEVVINLPRPKTHPIAGHTVSIKNLVGTMRTQGACTDGIPHSGLAVLASLCSPTSR